MTGLAVVFLLVLAVAYSQECGASPPLTAENMPPQKVAYVQIETNGGNGYRALMKLGYDGLLTTMAARYPKSTADFFLCSETNCLNGIDLSSYTQVMVNDMSANPDNTAAHMAGYAKIANWYTTTRQKPTIICDARIRSSLWSGRYNAFNNAVRMNAGNLRPNHRLWENYFVNLGIRGGGLLLATDHAPTWTQGINEINKQIGINEFVRDFSSEPWALEIDESSPVLSYPTDASDFTYNGRRYLWDDSSTGDTPISEQKNGKIMYPVGWHGSIGFNRPGVSSSIRGSIGFLVDITAPKCGALYLGGASVVFTAVKKAGVNNVASWVWTSNVQGEIGTGATFSTTTLSPGQHIIKVKAKDTQQFVAEAQVVVFITFSSGKAECIVTARDGQQVQEYFPIQRPQAVTSWYQYGTPTAKEPNDSDKIENIPLTGNLALYNDNKGYSLVFIGSKNAGPATITLRISLSDVVKTTKVAAKIQLIDDAGDRWLEWDEATNTGIARITEWQGTSKGFVIGPFPDAKTDRWCLNVEVDVASVTGLNFINTWGHVRNSDSFPSTVLLGHSAYGATTTKKFQFCRAQCTCGASELRDKMAGVIEPVRVNPGDGGSIGSIYKQGLLCTWNISPKDATGKAPAGGIILWYSAPFNVANEDSVNVYKGIEGGPAVYQGLKGTNIPSAKIVDGPQATVVFSTTNVLKTQYGFILNYAAMPKLTSANPIRGPLTEPTTVVLTGESFVDNPDFRVRVTYGGGKIMDLIPAKITPTQVTVSIPPQNVGTATISVSNDKDSGALGFTGAVAYNWFDASCGAIKTCAGCAARKADCGWCNNPDPSLSACIPQGGNTPCPGDAKNLDVGCCTKCSLLQGCNGGGKCACNDTCVCDDKHWGADCSCNQCVKGKNGVICSGNGNCDCKTGGCVCKAGWRGPDCSCKTCEGNPPCSGHGTCNCDGTCSCNAGWTHVGPQKICDCSTTCPNDCSKKGVCKCGSCECDAGYDLLPDCSCKDCDQVCGANQVCNCQGKCECTPGFNGKNCTEKTDCGKLDNCKKCAQNEDCGWCDEMNVCENVFAPVACADKDEPGSKNPRDFKLITNKELCEAAVIADKENLSENKSSALIGAVVGSLGVAALGLMAMAFFLRPEAAAPGMLGADLSHLAGEGFINSAIHTEAGTGGSSGIFQA